jgi:hypothetical protein
VLLAGLEVPERLVLELAHCLRTMGCEDTANTLEDAYDGGNGIVSLATADRDAIQRALADCPYGLSELRSVMLLEQRRLHATAGHGAPSD